MRKTIAMWIVAVLLVTALLTLLACFMPKDEGFVQNVSGETAEPLDEGYPLAIIPAPSMLNDGEYESDPDNAWTVEGITADDIYYENITIYVNNDVVIEEDANLTLKNCRIIMNYTGVPEDTYGWKIYGSLKAYNCTFEHVFRLKPQFLTLSYYFQLMTNATVVFNRTTFYNFDETLPDIELGVSGVPDIPWYGRFVCISSTLNVTEINAETAAGGDSTDPQFITCNTNLTVPPTIGAGEMTWNNSYLHTITIEGANTLLYNVSIADLNNNRTYDNRTTPGTWARNGSVPAYMADYIPHELTLMNHTIWFILENVSIDAADTTYFHTWPVNATVQVPSTWPLAQTVAREYNEDHIAKMNYDHNMGWGRDFETRIGLNKAVYKYRLSYLSKTTGYVKLRLWASDPWNYTVGTPRQPYDPDADLDDDAAFSDLYYGGGAHIERNTILPNAGNDRTIYQGDNITFTANATTSEETITVWSWSLTNNTSGAVVSTFTGKYYIMRNVTLLPGDYTATLTAIDGEGASGTDAMNLHILPKRLVPGGTASLTEDDEDDDGTSYDWWPTGWLRFWDGDMWVALWDDVLTAPWFLFIVIMLMGVEIILIMIYGHPLGPLGKRH